MDLRWPDSGSLLDSLLSEAGDPATTGSGGLSGVTPAHLDAALAALQRGDVEYLILEDGARFLQAAGDGDGPYQVQVTNDGETMHDIDDGVDAVTMQRILRAYLRGDHTWRDAPWTPPLGF
ncbi:hypothetical protein [Luteitalea sp.]|uniref:hypothetical protein n=1 Tax=Luteitalea sp. TaxID=2004800 RepID=UPI0025C0681B|nr:hypothetical protein [Luteitalea sp.]